jgi:hypothetical protein
VASGGRERQDEGKAKVSGTRERVSRATPYDADG